MANITPLDIEISKPGKNTVDSDFILKILGDFKQKPIDTFVREGLQNCLDARIDGTPKVCVDIDVIEGESKTFLSLLGNKTQKNTKWQKTHKVKTRHKMLVLRDCCTTGLDGELGPALTSKFERLVYKIGDGKKEVGAGGSYGLGSTIFSKMGIGFVVFYTQVRNKQGKVKKRLAVTCIEPKDNAVITGSPNGVAWWGKNDSKGNSAPVTDSRRNDDIIKSLLQYHPYAKNETGTTIIIPFVSEEHILKLNNKGAPPWEKSLKGSLRMAVQRWYGNRLTVTPRLPTLNITTDNQELKADKCKPVFREFQKLKGIIYTTRNKSVNSGIRFNRDKNTEWKEAAGDDSDAAGFLKAIKLKDTLENSKPAGWLAVCKLSRRDLDLVEPNYIGDPHDYLFGDTQEDIKSRPIVALSRKPQMIVRYDTNAWSRGIENPEGEYILALFMLNSEAHIKGSKEGLEEYVGKREGATHANWSDDAGMNIIGRIRANVIKGIKEAFFPDQKVGVDLTAGEQLRNDLGRKLLPEGFGTSASSGGGGGGGGSSELGLRRGADSPTFEINHVEHTAEGKKIVITIYTAGANSLKLYVKASQGVGAPINSTQWKDQKRGLTGEFPLMFKSNVLESVCSMTKKGKESKSSTISSRDLIHEISSNDRSLIGIQIANKIKAPVQIAMQLDVTSRDISIVPVLELS